uniref:Mab-21 domain-containing protein n=1 Tax=Macrostomum lignano TaxID=282301 RepID=A0A1I8JLN1_9PLAT
MTCSGTHPDSLQIAQTAVPSGSTGDEASSSKRANCKSAVILAHPFPLADVADAFRDKYRAYIGYTIETAGQRELTTHMSKNAIDMKKSIECLGFRRLDEDMAECLLADADKLSLTVLTSGDENPAISGPSFLTAKLKAEPLSEILACDWQLHQHLRQLEEKLSQANISFLTDSGRVYNIEYFLPSSKPRQRQLINVQSSNSAKAIRDCLLSGTPLQQASLQAYIEQPLLVDKRKFDIRTFLMLVCPKRGGAGGRTNDSGYFAFHHPGFLHLRLEPFNPQYPEPSQDGPKYQTSQQLMEACTWYPDELNAYLNRKKGFRMPPDWVKVRLYPQARAVLGYLAGLLRWNLHDRVSATSSFRIISAHMLLDESLRLHLLKLDDDAPNWSRPTSVVDSVLSSIWQEAVCLACEIAIRFRSGRTISDDHLVTRRNFRMVYSSEDLCLARQSVTLMYD